MLTEAVLGKVEKRIEMGGQAVIEGVMMRSPQGYAIAIRKKDKTIKIKSIPYKPLTKRIKILSLPLLRGVATLLEMLVIGLKGLDFSINEWEGQEKKGSGEERTAVVEDAGQSRKESGVGAAGEKRQISVAGMVGLITFSLAFAMVLTVVIPNILTHFLGFLPFSRNNPSHLVEDRSPITYNLIAGFFRAAILIAYIWVISLSKDIRRVFEYHGAEHKAVFAFEEEKSLTLENVRPYTTHHPRCGTTFLGVVIIVSIIVFAFIVKLLLLIYPPFPTLPFILRKVIIIFSHILFMPLVAGVSYEVIKFGSRHKNNLLTKILVYPGLLSQYLTTKPPDDEQMEVSIASLKAAIAITPEQTAPFLTILAPGDALK